MYTRVQYNQRIEKLVKWNARMAECWVEDARLQDSDSPTLHRMSYIFAPDRFRRGSRISRRASPRRLMPSTVTKRHRPGKSGSHHAVLMYIRASASMVPQVGISGGSPTPRKL